VPAAPADHYFQMQGKPVFKQAVLRMTGSARAALDRAGWRTGEVDRFVGHQEQLGLPADRIVRNIDSVGNTAAASIPLALADAAGSGQLRPGHKVLLSAFGGGLTWGSTTLLWPDPSTI